MVNRKVVLVVLGVLVTVSLAVVGVSAQSSGNTEAASESPAVRAVGTPSEYRTSANAAAASELTGQEILQRETVLRIVDEAFMPGDFDVLDRYLSDAYVNHTPFGDLDREGVKNFLTALRGALSSFEAARDPVLVEGRLVAGRGILSGVFSREFAGPTGVIPPNNQPIVFEFINIFRFDDDGKIVEEWVQFDALGFFTQLGAVASN